MSRSKVSSFEIVQSLLKRVDKLFDLIKIDQDTTFISGILQLGRDIQAACEADGDAMVGTIALVSYPRYGIERALRNAILCEVSCIRMGKDPLDRMPTLLAALTHDVGMYDIQQQLFEQTEPLTSTQQHIIKTHPQEGCDLLRSKGVTDKRWLSAVLYHHERLDGSGYPYGKLKERLSFDAKLLALTENYMSLIRPRADQKRVLHKDALRTILQERGVAIDEGLATLFIHSIGIYSPGCLIQLEGGSVGIVLGLTQKLNFPEVMLLTDIGGKPLEKTKRINTYERDIKIANILDPAEYLHLLKNLKDLWMVERPF